MIQRPAGVGAFQFVILSTLRAQQLIRGCRPKVDSGVHKHTITAQMEVAEGKITQFTPPPIGFDAPVLIREVEEEPVLVERS